MSKNLDAVLKAWESGKPYDKRKRSYNGLYGCDGTTNPCWTDGQTVYSYAKRIMWRDDSGAVTIAERDSTRTTNRHIDQCHWHVRKNSIEQVADDVLRDCAAE